MIKGSGVSKTDTRAASGFRRVSLGIDARVELRQGDIEGVTVTGDDNIVPLVETVVEKGTLKIRWPVDQHFSLTYRKLDIVVNLKDIDGIRLGGSGYIHAARLKTGTLQASLAGSGDILLDALDADTLQGSIAGSGKLKAAGRADKRGVHARGFGRLRRPQARIPPRVGQRAGLGRRDRLGDRIADRDDRRLGRRQILRQAAGHEDRRGLGQRATGARRHLSGGDVRGRAPPRRSPAWR